MPDNFGENIDQNAAQFAKSLMDMASYVEDKIDAVIRKACLDLYRSIVDRTPVDTGRAKGSWGISIDSQGSHELAYDKDGYSYNEIAGIINDQVSDFTVEMVGDEVIIYNNLEYINKLESGNWSDQAPNGMVSVSLAAFTQFFNNAINQLAGDLT